MKSKSSVSVALLVALFVISSTGIAFSASAVSETGSGPDGNWSAQTCVHVNGVSPMISASPTGMSPAQVKAAYNLPSSGGSGVIAIIDAYHNPSVVSDLEVFRTAMGMAAPNFDVHRMSLTTPVDSGWALESSLDVQWACAIAPQAKILLVEANSNSFSDLISAIDFAKNYQGVVAVSMSWGGTEFRGVSIYDSVFTPSSVNPSIKFFASSGDDGKGVIWPAVSPNVIAVGGTTLNLNTDGSVAPETAWSGSGGGVSKYVSQPSYQASFGIASTMRTVPDVSYDADPNTGFSVYDSTYTGTSGWYQVGGTSAGAPQWAAIQSLGLSSSNSNFYQDAKTSYASYFRDITSGSNGYPAKAGYDYVTGLGSPLTWKFTPSISSDFSISASKSSMTIKAGSSGSTGISVASVSGFSGTVALSTSKLSGWTITLPASTTVSSGASTSSSLSVTVPSSAAAGTYTITVTGTSGSINHATTVTVTVTASTHGGGHH